MFKRIPYKPIIIFSTIIIMSIVAFIWAVGGTTDMTLIKGMTGGDISSDIDITPLKIPSAGELKAPEPAKKDGGTSNPIEPLPARPSPPDSSRIYNPLTGEYYANTDVAVTGAIMHDGECWAYNSKAQRINISSSECSKYLASFGNMAKPASSSKMDYRSQ